MIAAALWLVRVRKEVRGIAPAWLAGVALMVVSVLDDSFPLVAIAGYVSGAVALGALSVGHEYGNQTVTLFLSQPSRRVALFVQKLVVLVAMMAVFAAVGWVALMAPDGFTRSLGLSPGARLLTFSLPLLCGLLLAPWLTMACRNALAGIVFSVAIPVGLWLFVFDFFWPAMVIVLACAGLASWRTFMRLEGIDGRGFDLHLPSWGATDTDLVAGPSHSPWWLLVGKEFRLQQLTLVVSGVYLAVWFGLTVFGGWLLSEPQMADALVTALSVLHAGAIPLLAGSLASAEERNFGTLGWQVLLPVSMWKQWVIKSLVVIGVSVGLAIGLPALIAALAGTNDARMAVEPLLDLEPALMVVGVSAASLYVSSLTGNGLRAILVTLPLLIIVGGLVANAVLRNTFSTLYVIRTTLQNPARFEFVDITLAGVLAAWLIVGGGGLLVMLLAFAMSNHRSAERGSVRMASQVGWITASAVVWATIWSVVFMLQSERFSARMRDLAAQRDAERAVAVFDINGAGMSTTSNTLVVLFYPERQGRAQAFDVIGANQAGNFTRTFLAARDGHAAVAVAVPEGTSAWQFERQLISFPAQRESLRVFATPLTLRSGETVSLPLTPAPVPEIPR